MENATIHIERQAAWIYSLRAFRIFIDGKVSGTIRQRESRTFEVQPGPHEVFLKVDDIESRHLTITNVAGEEVKLICKGNMPSGRFFGYYKLFFAVLDRDPDLIKLYPE